MAGQTLANSMAARLVMPAFNACLRVTFVLLRVVPELRYYLTGKGDSPFEDCYSGLDQMAAAKVSVAIARLGVGHASNAKGIGEGVLEYRIDWGPGYRVYFGRDGETLVILLTGDTKQRQARDIARAKEFWADYRRRRRKPAV